MKNNLRALLALASLLPLSQAALAAESFDNCTGFIESLPANLSTQGTWCMRKDLATAMTTGAAITIYAPNVTIDCNGYKLGGLAAGPATTAVGIDASGRSNTVIRNCNVRGFLIGARIGDGAPLVEDNRFEGNTGTGILVTGAGGVVRRNLVVTTGGSTVAPHAVAIYSEMDTDIIDNTIDTVIPRAGGAGSGWGIFLDANTGGSIVGNRIRNVMGDGAGLASGIGTSDASRLTIADNQVIGLGTGVAIACNDANSTAKDNTTAGFATGIFGCDDDGGNLSAN